MAQLEKTLANTWSVPGKRGVEPSLVQYALQQLRTRAAQAEAAAAPGAAEGGLAGGGPGGRLGSGGDDALTAALWRLVRKTPMNAAPLLTFVNIKVPGFSGWPSGVPLGALAIRETACMLLLGLAAYSSARRRAPAMRAATDVPSFTRHTRPPCRTAARCS